MRRIRALADDGSSWRVDVPEDRRERVRGLIGSPPPAAGRGLLLLHTRSIHTFGMRYPIAVVLLDAGLRVRRVLRVAPRRIVLPRVGVAHVLECAVDSDLGPGLRLVIQAQAQPRRSRTSA